MARMPACHRLVFIVAHITMLKPATSHHHPAATLEGLGTQDGQGVVMAAFGQPEGLVHHPIEPDQHRLQGSNVAGSLGSLPIPFAEFSEPLQV